MNSRNIAVFVGLLLGMSSNLLAAPSIGVIMHVPKDKALERQAELIHTEMERLLAEHPDFEFVSLEAALGNPKLLKHLKQSVKTDALMEQGIRFLDQGKHKQAQGKFSQAYRQYSRQGAYITDISPVVKSLELLGVTYLKRSNKKKAFKILNDALTLDPKIKPDSKYYTGSMPNFVYRVKKHRRKAGRGPVTLRSKPSNAMVFIDGKYKGMTPLKIRNSKAGLHFVRIAKRGYKSWGKQLRLKKGRMLKQMARLAPTNKFKKLQTNIRKLPLRTNLTNLTPSLKRVGEITGFDHIVVLQLKKNKKFTLGINGWLFDFSKKQLAGSALGTMPYGSNPSGFTEALGEFLKALLNDYNNEKHRLESMTPAEREAEEKRNILDFNGNQQETSMPANEPKGDMHQPRQEKPIEDGGSQEQGALTPNLYPEPQQKREYTKSAGQDSNEALPSWQQETESVFAAALSGKAQQPPPQQETPKSPLTASQPPPHRGSANEPSEASKSSASPVPLSADNIRVASSPKPAPPVHTDYIPAPVPFIEAKVSNFPVISSISAGAGIILCVVGALLTTNHISTLQDSNATSAEKTSARSNGLISLGLTGLGAISTVVGGTFIYLHYKD